MNGVHAMFSAKDIPGINSFTPELMLLDFKEEIFCSEKILYYGQPLALIVAETTGLAIRAAEKVKIIYKNVTTSPILNIRQALQSKDAEKRLLKNEIKFEATTKGSDIKKVIKGSFDLFGQYHYTMESQICLCVPVEDGMDVFSATQWMDLVNIAVANALNMPLNR